MDESRHNPSDCKLCPVFQKELGHMRENQEKRPCAAHGNQIENLVKSDEDFKKDSIAQWEAITQLRKIVWGWAPIMSFMGSVVGVVLGALIIYYLKGGK